MARSVTVRTGGSGIDARDFHDVARALHKAAPATSRALKRRLRKAGEIVAVEARAIASEHSQSIPPTIKVRTRAAAVEVIAGGPDAPVASLFELGNTRDAKSASASRKGSFRHPVYGNREVWVEQPMHRYLAPAAAAHMVEVEREVVGALEEATQIIAFGGHGG